MPTSSGSLDGFVITSAMVSTIGGSALIFRMKKQMGKGREEEMGKGRKETQKESTAYTASYCKRPKIG
jgi:hypothetical protein